MKIHFKVFGYIINTVFILLLVSLYFPYSIAETHEILPGDKAPDLKGVSAIGGHKVALYKYISELRYKRDKTGKLVKTTKGKYVSEFVRNVLVINFFSTTCIPCLREIPLYNRVAAKFKDRSVKLIYINLDPYENTSKIKKLISRYDIRVPMMMPDPKEVMRKYRIDTLPRIVVINRQKKITHHIKGFDKNLESRLTQNIEASLN
jgi:thiol-disulfide isomerase/thioredoxin